MKKLNVGDRMLLGFLYACTGLFSLLCLFPLWVALVASFSDEMSMVRNGYGLWPASFNLTAYKLVFTGTDSVMQAYLITIVTTAAGTLLTLIVTSAFAYPLTVKTLKARRQISLYAYATMLFNGGLVPTYILTTRLLHLQNNMLVLIIPAALNAYNVFLMRNYFATLPDALAESAKIDGANDMYIFYKIMLPLSKPILATIGLFAAMGYWNEWYKVLLFIDDQRLYTLQYLIMRIQTQVDFLQSSLGARAREALGGQSIPSVGLRMATAMISIGPIILLYPFLQKYFLKGITIGAVKG
ncbi:carbohydrate ABC transporter permease [Cohnella fermenti]|uniref:Carbohydrate ABC transporter permease n=1 Tax=Cohnella fermenti TaxID=2565925 RepID=A0A4S4BP30_9BACL|nr:carbohydrate ABC transporter permease [Cohnella fermenti]THF74294.1 carbohydrate ABC transporter permease [Cohnella fermenti]